MLDKLKTLLKRNKEVIKEQKDLLQLDVTPRNYEEKEKGEKQIKSSNFWEKRAKRKKVAKKSRKLNSKRSK